MKNIKPLGHKVYGSIPHFSNSKLGIGDYHCHEGQERIATIKARDKNDIIIVQEKLDGSNVGIAKVNGEILALTRSGYLAITSPYEQHHKFDEWVKSNKNRFEFLENGQRIVGEWLYQAHGTVYKLPHEPFVPFDIMTGTKRMSYFLSYEYFLDIDLPLINTIHLGLPIKTDDAMKLLGNGKHGAIDSVEGLIYRVERFGNVDFLCKYVRP